MTCLTFPELRLDKPLRPLSPGESQAIPARAPWYYCDFYQRISPKKPAGPNDFAQQSVVSPHRFNGVAESRPWATLF